MGLAGGLMGTVGDDVANFRVREGVYLPNPTFYNRNTEPEVGLTQNGDQARTMETAIQNVSFLAMPHLRYRNDSPY